MERKNIKTFVNELLHKLQTSLYDPVSTQRDLEILWQSIEVAIAKGLDVSHIILQELGRNEVFLEFLERKHAYGLIKKLSPSTFSKLLEVCMERIQSSPNTGGDDYIYFPVLERLQGLYNAMDSSEKKSLEDLLKPIATLPYLSPIIYLNLLSLLTSNNHSQLIALRMKKWKDDFLTALHSGDIGTLCDCLCLLAYLSTVDTFHSSAQNEMQQFDELNPYFPWLLEISSIESIPDCLQAVLMTNIKCRLPSITKLISAKPSYILDALLKSLDTIQQYSELSTVLFKLYLLESACKLPKTSNYAELELILAIEKRDLTTIAKIFDENDFKPWDKIGNSFTPIAIATKMVIQNQIKTKQALSLEEDLLAKRINEDFYFSFHCIVRDKLLNHTSPNQQIISIFEQIAFSANDVFSFEKNCLFFGEWDDPTNVYIQLMKIYLPLSDHNSWLKYCPPQDNELHDLTRSLYQGSQEAYGLWFHLMSLALQEKLQNSNDWDQISHLLGYQRNLIACFMLNIQIPRQYQPWTITFATQNQQQSYDKMCPGSPLNFGVLMSPWEEASTTMLNDLREHYLNNTKVLIQEFQYIHNVELSKINSPQKFEFEGREIQVFPMNGNFAYSITCPFYIVNQRVTATHLLWNWPAESSFFYSGHYPARTSPLTNFDTHYRWLHATGNDKQIIIQEVARLFTVLINIENNDSSFRENLARFLYLFFQAYMYRRGSAAIGIVLLNTILRIHGKSMQEALKPPFYWDCEAMCSTESEFIEKFLSTLQIK